MPTPEEEFDTAAPAEEEFDSAGSDEKQILAAETNPAFRIGHGQEMPVTKIEGGPQPNAIGETVGPGVNAERKQPWLASLLRVKQRETGDPLSSSVDPQTAGAATQHMEALTHPSGVAKDMAASTAATFAGAPAGFAGQVGLGALQAGTARMADDPNATAGDIGTSSLLGGGTAGTLNLLGQAGGKLINAGNRGLARIALSGAELARLRAIGGESKLADLGARIRSAGLDKGTGLAQKLTPTDAKRIADNAFATTESQGPNISRLEDQLLSKNEFGQTEVDTKPLTDELRGYTRPNSAETSTPETAAAMERQAQRFESPVEEIPVEGSVRVPPPLPNFSKPELPPGYTPQIPQQAELLLPTPPAPAPVPPAPPAVQQELPLPEPQYNYHATPPENVPKIAELGLRPEEGGKNFAFEKNKNSVYMSRPEDIGMWKDKVEGLTGTPPVELRTTAPAVTPPGANPAVRVRSEPVAPERIQYKTPEGGWNPVSEMATTPPEIPAAPSTQLPLDLSTQMSLNLPPGGKIAGGEFPAGGTEKPLEATAQLSEPYTVERAVADKRDIAKRLFDKKQRALAPTFGEDQARSTSWRFLKDRFQQELDKGVQSGVLPFEDVSAYRKASQDFHTAAEVQVDTAKRAEADLRRSAGFWKGGVEGVGDALPGTQNNLGRLLQKAPGAAPAAVNALPSSGKEPSIGRAAERGLGSQNLAPGQRQELEQKANSDLKSKMFRAWYNRLAGQGSQ